MAVVCVEHREYTNVSAITATRDWHWTSLTDWLQVTDYAKWGIPSVKTLPPLSYDVEPGFKERGKDILVKARENPAAPRINVTLSTEVR